MFTSRIACLVAALLFWLTCFAQADVLIVADEFPAMEVLAKRLKAEENRASQIVDQAHMPKSLGEFEAVVVYIHKGLAASAEGAFIDYAKTGGRLVLLHHSISSGKRQNRDWFTFLGVELPEGDVDQGGYKWTEDVTVQWLNVARNHFIMTNRVNYPRTVAVTESGGASRVVPAFTLHGTEVYLNHVLKGPRTGLMGLKYSDAKSGKSWVQNTAGWIRPAAKGWVLYFMPGHTLHDLEDAVYGRIVLNAITSDPAQLH